MSTVVWHCLTLSRADVMTRHMAKDLQIGVRMDAQTKAALETAAKADERTVSALVLKIVKEWLARQPQKGKSK